LPASLVLHAAGWEFLVLGWLPFFESGGPDYLWGALGSGLGRIDQLKGIVGVKSNGIPA